MSNHPKNRKVGEKVVEDRLSSLPRHLIDSILEHLPLHDAARTCVLSKTWINIWEFHPHLVLDHTFFSQPSIRDKRGVVDMILLRHAGPILNFHLDIPPNLNNPFNTPFIDAWVKNISGKGIKNLELKNTGSSARYQLPSSFFSCSQLTDLKLTNCTLNPPQKFGGFPNLIKIQLFNVSITADMTFGSQLQALDLARCTGIEHLRSQFRNTTSLRALGITECSEGDWQWFESTRTLHALILYRFNPVSSIKKSISLGKLIANTPHIFIMYLCGSTLKCLEPGPKSLATTMYNLRSLHLYSLEVSEFRQISNALCLIKSSPNLQHLVIKLEHEAAIDLAVESYLGSPDRMNIILDQLQTIDICGVAGSRAELHLVKFLLSSSPVLKTITLKHDSTISDHKTELEIAIKLMGLPRASSVAEMIWT